MLRSLLNQAGMGSVLLLEDVDAAFAKRESGDGAKHLTFSGARIMCCAAKHLFAWQSCAVTQLSVPEAQARMTGNIAALGRGRARTRAQ